MTIERIEADEAKARLDEGWIYLDVRSVPEFEEGHCPGALNVPLLHRTPAGMVPNPEFLPVLERVVPKDAKVVVGCKSGGRSLRAAQMMRAAGWQHVVDLRGGMHGEHDPMGQCTCEGWAQRGLPVTTEASNAQTWEGLRARAGR
ncbi:MAG: rhodanese-like domain-containing protein [Deltaproteobacteria bacterium]|nr:MAG: rhodanese-like domain-containing protein [Deltaproteobacteria bacterium]